MRAKSASKTITIGKRSITADTALRLARLLKTSPQRRVGHEGLEVALQALTHRLPRAHLTAVPALSSGPDRDLTRATNDVVANRL